MIEADKACDSHMVLFRWRRAVLDGGSNGLFSFGSGGGQPQVRHEDHFIISVQGTDPEQLRHMQADLNIAELAFVDDSAADTYHKTELFALVQHARHIAHKWRQEHGHRFGSDPNGLQGGRLWVTGHSLGGFVSERLVGLGAAARNVTFAAPFVSLRKQGRLPNLAVNVTVMGDPVGDLCNRWLSSRLADTRLSAPSHVLLDGTAIQGSSDDAGGGSSSSSSSSNATPAGEATERASAEGDQLAVTEQAGAPEDGSRTSRLRQLFRFGSDTDASADGNPAKQSKRGKDRSLVGQHSIGVIAGLLEEHAWSEDGLERDHGALTTQPLAPGTLDRLEGRPPAAAELLEDEEGDEDHATGTGRQGGAQPSLFSSLGSRTLRVFRGATGRRTATERLVDAAMRGCVHVRVAIVPSNTVPADVEARASGGSEARVPPSWSWTGASNEVSGAATAETAEADGSSAAAVAEAEAGDHPVVLALSKWAKRFRNQDMPRVQLELVDSSAMVGDPVETRRNRDDPPWLRQPATDGRAVIVHTGPLSESDTLAALRQMQGAALWAQVIARLEADGRPSDELLGQLEGFVEALQGASAFSEVPLEQRLPVTPVQLQHSASRVIDEALQDERVQEWQGKVVEAAEKYDSAFHKAKSAFGWFRAAAQVVDRARQGGPKASDKLSAGLAELPGALDRLQAAGDAPTAAELMERVVKGRLSWLPGVGAIRFNDPPAPEALPRVDDLKEDRWGETLVKRLMSGLKDEDAVEAGKDKSGREGGGDESASCGAEEQLEAAVKELQHQLKAVLEEKAHERAARREQDK